jgi:DNA repair protein RadC
MKFFHTRDMQQGAGTGAVLPTGERERLKSALTKLVGPRDSHRLLDSAGEAGVLRWPASHLAAACGVPQKSADKVVAARELHLHRQGDKPGRISCPSDALAYLPPGYATWETETVIALALNAASQVQAVLLVVQGGSSAAALIPRDVFTPLVRFRAAAFVLVHNHPSGDATPSEADVILTNRIAAAGRVLAIELVDHIIVASGGCTSLLEASLLPTDAELAKAAGDEPEQQPTA